MATTRKKNFRADPDEWQAGLDKAERMRREGYDVDLTVVLNKALREFIDEADDASAQRMGLPRNTVAVPIYRAPLPRAGTR